MKVVHSAEAPWEDALSRGSYQQKRKPLGGEKLKASLWQLAPGKKSFPLHTHQITEEALYVISGAGKVRTPDGQTGIGPGDFVSFPPGGPAHQLINDGKEPLVYVGLSANAAGADVVMYPDTGKVAMALGEFPKGKRMVFQEKDQADYFAGDKDA